MNQVKKSNEKSIFTISELAREFDISPRTIRFYEEKKLISPRRTQGNQRRYTRRDRARLKLILRGKRFGYSLEEIGEMIGMTDTDMDEVDQIEKTLTYGNAKLSEIRARIKDLELLEQDLLETKKKLLDRLSGLKEE